MSLDRHNQSLPDGVSYARVKRKAYDVYVQDPFMGRQRPPKSADEAGALCVVELLFGGRALIYAIDSDNTHRRVVIARDE
jgi:hypothetical protein